MFRVSNTMEPFGIYVHWPFCLSKCPYCDFNSHVRDQIDQDRWCRAMLREIKHTANHWDGATVTSIFFGGGTPSLMPPKTISAVVEKVGEYWGLDQKVEITVEANPTSVESGRFAELKNAGVNRISLGVQALDNDVLSFLGRGHSVTEAIAAIEIAATHFERYSFDLIYARPGQTLLDWHQELDSALALAGSHLSLYQLTIERGTPFYGLWQQGRLTQLDENQAAEMYEFTQERLSDAGLPGYEISNHATPGSECQHNLLYWHYGNYAGVGPGAHARLKKDNQKYALERRKLPERWLQMVETEGHGTRQAEALNTNDRLVELVLMGLRTHRGIPHAQFLSEIGKPIESCLDNEALNAFLANNLLANEKGVLRATASGRARLNAITESLLA
ncbi:MAG: coproporphyrinogen III oxidase [Rickettsiales bacterium]|nr:coproporphyrinogen III oxidase [Rickettsiales bacterium]